MFFKVPLKRSQKWKLISLIASFPLFVLFQNFSYQAMNQNLLPGCFPENYQSQTIYSCLNRGYPAADPSFGGYDLYLPPGYSTLSNVKYPLIIWIHGGSYGGRQYNLPSARNEDSGFVDAAKNFAAMGYMVANIDYTPGVYVKEVTDANGVAIKVYTYRKDIENTEDFALRTYVSGFRDIGRFEIGRAHV